MNLLTKYLIGVVIAWVAWMGLVQAETVKIATGEYEPWTTEKSKYGGFVNRVVKEAFSRKGVEVTFEYLPWKRAELDNKEGRTLISSFWFSSPEFDKDYVLSDPISDHRELFFHLKSKPLPKWSTLKDLSAITVGVTRSYTYTPELWALSRERVLKTDETTTDEQNMKKLLAGRIDTFPVDEVLAWKLLSDTKIFAAGTKDLVTTDAKPLKVMQGHLRFTKNDPKTKELVIKFNAGLAEMRKDGTYDKYYQELFAGTY